MARKLTKKILKDFFNFIKDETTDNSSQISELLNEFPQLSNAIVSGMAKGIDGYSALMLAIRFYNINIAKTLVIAGADVNFIDSSNVRTKHLYVFYDLIYALHYFISNKNFKEVQNCFELWDLMDKQTLDYSTKTNENDKTWHPENCIQFFIRYIGARYGNNHFVHNETKYDPPNHYVSIFRFSNESRDLISEEWFEKIAVRLINSTGIEQVKDLDANHGRGISGNILPFYRENGYVDSFSLTLINKLVYSKYGFEIKNMYDTDFIKRYDKNLFFYKNNH